MSDGELDLRTILGMGLTLREYQRRYLRGRTPYYETKPLVFECTHCGACCSRPGVVYITEQDMEAIGEFLGLEREALRAQYLVEDLGDWVLEVAEEKDCPFFVEERCVIHPVKPQQCRTYPFWPEIVATEGTWRGESTRCPGIGVGREYGAAEVRSMLVGDGRTP